MDLKGFYALLFTLHKYIQIIKSLQQSIGGHRPLFRKKFKYKILLTWKTT